jgi:hypothetical protein
MRRFIAPTAVAGMAIASILLGTPAAAAPSDTHTLAQPNLPSPPPPELAPPRCIPRDQSDRTYEWRYNSTRTLGDAIAHEFYISYAGRSTSPFELARKVSCSPSTGAAGSGLDL